MRTTYFTIAFLFLILLIPTATSGPFIKHRVRIINVTFDHEIITLEDPFTLKVNITKERWLPFNGEIQVYLTCAGLIKEKIGENTNIIFKSGEPSMNTFEVKCDINDVEADWYQESYGLQIILSSKKLGFLIQKDTYSIETIRVISKHLEINKLSISSFKPPEEWNTEGKLTGDLDVKKSDIVEVTIANEGMYKCDAIIVIYIVEKTSLGIPLIEGIGEYKKEIGRHPISIDPGDEVPFDVSCTLRKADQEKINRSRNFDLQVAIFVEIDRALYQVDVSTIQTVNVPINTISNWIYPGFGSSLLRLSKHSF